MTGNCHVRFLEGRASAMGSGYSILADYISYFRLSRRAGGSQRLSAADFSEADLH